MYKSLLHQRSQRDLSAAEIIARKQIKLLQDLKPPLHHLILLNGFPVLFRYLGAGGIEWR
jgi:hypothetical protein